jgi:hypothetical protein
MPLQRMSLEKCYRKNAIRKMLLKRMPLEKRTLEKCFRKNAIRKIL